MERNKRERGANNKRKKHRKVKKTREKDRGHP